MPDEPHPHTPKRNASQRIADLEAIAEMAIQGLTTREMAAELATKRPYTLSHVQISKDLKKAKNEWQTAASEHIETIRARELAGLARQEKEAWAEWHRSKQDAKVKTSKVKQGGQGTANEVSATTTGQCGDPAYMRLILEIRDRRAAMLGLNAATKTELTGAGGGPLAIEAEYDLEHLTEFAIQLGREKESNPAGSEERQGETV